MTHLRRWSGALLLLAGAGLGGCTPAVQLRSATLRSATPQGAQFDAILAVDNPNAFDIQIRTVRANVRVGSNPMPIPVQFDSGMWIQAHHTALVPVPVTVPWNVAPTIAFGAFGRQPVPFRIVGKADVTATRAFEIERDAYAFDEEGVLPRSFFVRQQAGAALFPFTLGVGAPR